MQIPLFKTCSVCGHSKFITQFYKSKGEKDGHQYCCKSCHNARTLRWREENPEKNQERIQRDISSDRHKSYNERYYSEHKDLYRESHRRSNEKHRDSRNARSRNYQKEHPEYFRLKVNERRAMELERGTFTQAEWDSLCARYNYTCLCCKQVKPLTFDHVVPLSKGGSNTIDNIQPLCLKCNQKKHNKIIDYRF